MNGIASGFHPSFDALSAYADRPDVARARTRVGRHVAKCGQCRELVEDIQAMGAAARAIELPGVPDGLWSRIEQGAAQPRQDVEPVRSPRRQVPLGIAAAAVLTLGVVIVGSLRSLGAATPSRLSLSREFVAPGGSAVARYRPIDALADRPELTVWARYEDTTTVRISDDPPLVRAGILRRVSAQEYVGSLVLPVGRAIGFFAVGDSSGQVLDRSSGRPRFLATLLAAGDSGRPSFDALVVLLGQYRNRLEDVDAARAADLMERHYPARPETWLLTNSIKHGGVIRDFVARFESLERSFAGWDERLADERNLSAYVEQTMANVASYVEEPSRADFWRKRLAADHPEYHHSADLILAENADVPTDSIRIVLAAYERMRDSMQGERPLMTDLHAVGLAERSGDSTLLRTWRLRLASTSSWWVVRWASMAWLHDPSALAELDGLLRRNLAAMQSDGAGARGGVPTVHQSAAESAHRSAQRLAAIRSRLAAIQLLRGQSSVARESLDVIVREAGAGCPMPETLRWRAEAELKLGQMDAAREDLAYLAAIPNWRVAAVGDSAATLLGATYSAEGWGRARERARSRLAACSAVDRERRKGER